MSDDEAEEDDTEAKEGEVEEVEAEDKKEKKVLRAKHEIWNH